jgi:hypothetical protein
MAYHRLNKAALGVLQQAESSLRAVAQGREPRRFSVDASAWQKSKRDIRH